MSELIQVSDSVWCLRRRSYFACSYIVKSRSSIVLVDAGMSSDGIEMLKAVQSLGFELKNIKGILLTHWHNDHSAGACAIAEVTSAPVFYHEADAPYFNRRVARQSLTSRIGDLIPEMGVLVLCKGLLSNSLPRPVLAQSFVHDKETVLDDFEVIETPGHTPGHVCYYFRPSKILFAGDALAVVGKELRFMSRVVTPDISAARESMKLCINRDIEIICPGHRQPLSKGVLDQKNRFIKKLQSNHWPLFG